MSLLATEKKLTGPAMDRGQCRRSSPGCCNLGYETWEVQTEWGEMCSNFPSVMTACCRLRRQADLAASLVLEWCVTGYCSSASTLLVVHSHLFLP